MVQKDAICRTLPSAITHNLGNPLVPLVIARDYLDLAFTFLYLRQEKYLHFEFLS
jgi:hypothetical protein